MLTIAMANQKGGVGKTTATRNFARSAALLHLRCLVADHDPQGNLTTALATPDMPAGVAGVADALSARVDDQLKDVLVPTIWSGVTLAPTSEDDDVLESVRDELVVAGAGREGRLRAQLAELEDDYDLVLIDTRPALDQLTINALVAADTVVIVTNPELFSANGIGKLNRTIETVREHYNPALLVGGLLINYHEAGNTILSKHWVDEIKQSGLPLLEPPIPRHTWIGSATQQGVALDEVSAAGAAVQSIYTQHLRTLMGDLA